MLGHIFRKRREEPSKQTALAVIEPAIVERELSLWLSPTYETEAKARFEEMRSALGLGLRNQAMLDAQEVVLLYFRDFAEGNSLDAVEFRLRPLTENLDTGLFRVEGAIDMWMMHELDTKVVRLPQGALDALQTLKRFPPCFVQDVRVLRKVEKRPSVTDYRFTGEKPSYLPTIIPEPDPLLVVKVGNRWFSVYRWE